MTEEYINPVDPRRISLAEMSVVEQLMSLSSHVRDSMGESVKIVEDLVEGKKEAIKARYERIRSLKNSAEEVKDKTLEYIVRIAPTLIYKDLYAAVVNMLERVAQNMDALAYRVLVTSRQNASVGQETGRMVAEFASTVFKAYDKLHDAIRMLSMNSARKSVEAAKEVSKLEDAADSLYRNITPHLYSSYSSDISMLMLLKEIVDTLEDTCDVIKEAADNLRYLALHKY